MVKKKAKDLPKLSEGLLKSRQTDVLELDELCSFVQRKSNKKWIWIALCKRTRQVVAYVVGKRNKKSCVKLWKRIPQSYKHCHTFSDFWKSYEVIFPEKRHTSVGKETGLTNHVERWNNTLRQRLSRFVRKTLSFSKKNKFHKIVLKIFIWNYNQYAVSRF